MSNLKYIILDGGKAGLPDIPILFPNFIDHNVIAQQFSRFTPLSAGFVQLEGTSIRCVGESHSLKLKPNTWDCILIGKLLTKE